jgi:hypothetical protein
MIRDLNYPSIIEINQNGQSDDYAMDFDNGYDNNPYNYDPNNPFIQNGKFSNSDLCIDCESHFILCSLCNGYFDMSSYDTHESACSRMIISYKNRENLVECKDCRSYVKADAFGKHKDECVNKIKNERLACTHCKEQFSITLIEEHEKTCANLQTELMLAKETIDCSFCNEKIPMCHIQAHEVTCRKLKERQEELKKQVSLIEIDYPKEWEKEIYDIEYVNDNLSIITLDYNGTEFKFAENLMKQSVPSVNITNVYRIQNKHLWQRYFREKARVGEEKKLKVKEAWLFHGTRTNNPKSLINIGFDISFASDGGSLGRGIYFARQALYSYGRYCYVENGKGFLFLAKVITGESWNLGSKKGNNKIVSGIGLKKPPFWDESKFIYYDSVTDGSTMSVIYENDKAYPYYLIEYDTAQVNSLMPVGPPYPFPINPRPIPPNNIFFNKNNNYNYDDDESI